MEIALHVEGEGRSARRAQFSLVTEGEWRLLCRFWYLFDLQECRHLGRQTLELPNETRHRTTVDRGLALARAGNRQFKWTRLAYWAGMGPSAAGMDLNGPAKKP
jgi:hypothetical protein